ncbi:MAG: O-antigen [Geobacteraceae bacterium]|nr:MAG: O-antigen [Geobacteraceae bacterium]
MVLFFIAQVYTIAILFKQKINSQAITLFLYFISSLLLSASIGLLNGAELDLVLGDIKPLSYFIMVLFFSVVIDNHQRVMLVVKAVKSCSVILMVIYFAILTGLYFKLIPFSLFYERMTATGEVFFRPVGFFYKGFLYLCVGFLFFLFSDKKSNKLIAALLFLSIVLTFTRGFLLSTAATLIAYTIFYARRNVKTLIKIFLLAASLVLFTPWFVAQLGDKSESNLTRIVTYEQVTESLNPFSFFVGHGLGIGVAERSEHMEASFLEIFHKQGVVGLSFWFLIFLMIIWSYSRIRKKECRDIALPFVLSTVLIYIQTVTNPYLNNPIGMSMILITLSVLRVLGDEKLA